MQVFQYRLVQKHYRNSIQWEDGPGSLQNVVSKVRTRVVRSWDRRDEEFARSIIKSGLTGLELDSDDGWDEYSYHLERRATSTESWKYVGHVKSIPDSDCN